MLSNFNSNFKRHACAVTCRCLLVSQPSGHVVTCQEHKRAVPGGDNEGAAGAAASASSQACEPPARPPRPPLLPTAGLLLGRSRSAKWTAGSKHENGALAAAPAPSDCLRTTVCQSRKRLSAPVAVMGCIIAHLLDELQHTSTADLACDQQHLRAAAASTASATEMACPPLPAPVLEGPFTMPRMARGRRRPTKAASSACVQCSEYGTWCSSRRAACVSAMQENQFEK